jgi:hypothetical protein
MGHGAVAFTDQNDQIRFVLNHEFLRDIAGGAIVANIANDGLEAAA